MPLYGDGRGPAVQILDGRRHLTEELQLSLKKAIKMNDCTQNSYHSMEMVEDQQSKYLME